MKLNSRQLEAVYFGPYPLLILAGAGTGKTTTIVERIAYLINNTDIESENVLALTFSVDAAENLKVKLADKNIPDCELITTGTFHAFAKNIIDKYSAQLGYFRAPSLATKDDLVHLFLKHLNSLDLFKSKIFNRNPVEAIKSLLSLHDQFKQELFEVSDIEDIKSVCLDKTINDSDSSLDYYSQIYDAANTYYSFDRIKKENSFIEYEDMIYELWALINSNSEVLQSITDQYKFIIVDEFQDNNFAFSEIIKKIASHNNITVVGDDDQSIYSFRGANAYNIDDFDKYYSKFSNYKKVELIHNYRSNQKILNLANDVIVNNQIRMNKGSLKSPLEDCNSNGLVNLYVGEVESQYSQIIDIVSKFLKKKDDGKIAILCRTNSDCMKVSKALKVYGIDHNYPATKLFENRAVKDVVAILNLIAETKYDVHSIIRLSKDNLPDSFKYNIIQLSKNNIGILKQCLNSKNLFNSNEYEWLNRIYSISLKKDVFNSVIDFVVNDCNIASDDMPYIHNLKLIAERFYSCYNPESLKDFCGYINMLFENNTSVVNGLKSCDSCIEVMTVHNSKGIEFDSVVLPFLQSAKFPQSMKNPKFCSRLPLEFKKWSNEGLSSKEHHLEEERRLFYVACTRAKENLHLLTTPKRQSKFIKEINNQLYLENNIGDMRPIYVTNKVSERFSGSLDRISLSASKIDNYNRCQLKYKYNALDLIPQFRFNPIFSLGNIIHKVLEQFHVKKMYEFEDLINALDENWDKSLYPYDCESTQNYEDAVLMLENYYSYLINSKPSPALFEEFFSIELESCILSGFVDRIDLDGQNVAIYDYKTSRIQRSISQVKDAFQLPIYALAVYFNAIELGLDSNPNLSSILIAELSLRFEDVERKTVLSEEDILDLKDRINDIAKKISIGVFTANPNMMNCNYCDYKKFICSNYN